MSRLTNKVALVTGAARGIGRGISERFASEGAHVVIADVLEAEGQVAAEALGGTFIRLDVADEAQWHNAMATIEANLGRLDILVNNAGITGKLANPEDTAADEFRRVLDVNVIGVLLGCQAAIPAINRAGGGAIVNISSVAAFLANSTAMAYSASKATVRHMTTSVAQHCLEKRYKIRCNSIHPGILRTEMWDNAARVSAERQNLTFEKLLENTLRDVIPMGEFTRVEDVAGTAAFLVSDDSRHITGESIAVDGGLIHCNSYRPGSGVDAVDSLPTGSRTFHQSGDNREQ